ncbi:MAG: hypothetical protein E7596_03205 [Ruminococcaceae bacterium]|nr:hypothetical protein [Oscillospiraceae bacterium]
MDNRLVRLFKITVAIFAVLLLGVIGGFVTTIGAEEIHEHTFGETVLIDEASHGRYCTECDYVDNISEHNVNAEGMCVDCNSSYTLIHSVSGESKGYFKLENALDAIAEKGGTVTLTGNVECTNVTLMVSKADTTLDLAGFELRGVRFQLAPDINMTVVDSSEDKSGSIYDNTVVASSVSGKLELSGVKIVKSGLAVYNTGTLLIKDCLFTTSYNQVIVVGEKAKIDLINNVAEAEFKVNIHTEEYDNNLNIHSGSYSKITVNNPYGTRVLAIDLLPSGYAFANEDGLIMANMMQISNVTSVVEHKEHNFDYMSSDVICHWGTCTCGDTTEQSPSENHTLGEDGNCPVCQRKIEAEIDDGTTKQYIAYIVTALEKASELENAKVILRNNSYASSTAILTDCNVVLDLNGYELTAVEWIEVGKGATLTVCDTSAGGTGVLQGERVNYTTVSVRGNLIIESGNYIGLLDLIGVDSDDCATATINGGSFTGYSGTFCVYRNSTITINSAEFKEKYSIFNLYEDTTETISITLNGGRFINCEMFISAESHAYIDINSCLGNVNGCQKIFLDESGNEYVFQTENSAFECDIIVSHGESIIKSNDSVHYNYCEMCKEEFNYQAHRDYTYTPSKDDSAKHTIKCGVCDYSLGADVHTGGEANCTNLAVCDYCNSAYGEVDESNHTGGEASCIEKAICRRCEKPYGETASKNHKTTETKYVQSEDNELIHNRVFACCGEIIDTGSHENGVTTCTSKAVCTECGLEYGAEPKGHKYANDCDASCETCGEGREIGGHVYENACDVDCDSCGAERVTEHEFVPSGCEEKPKCILCGAEKDEKIGKHQYDNGCDTSCNNCGESREIGGHVYENACDGECNECGAKRMATHTYGVNGECLSCDSLTIPSEEPKTGVSTGAIVGTVTGTVVLFGGGTFALIWFVFRKRFI